MTSCLLIACSMAVLGCGKQVDHSLENQVSLLVGGEQYARLRELHEQRVQELIWVCMRNEGFDYRAPTSNELTSTQTAPPPSDPYYGIVAELDRLDADIIPEDELAPSEGNVNPEEHLAYELTLAGEGGCEAQSRSQADEEYAFERLALIEDRIATATRELNVDLEYERRLEEWRRCMALEGIGDLGSPSAIYDTIFEAWRSETQERGTSSDSLELERAIFEADSACADPSVERDLDEVARELLETDSELRDSVAVILNRIED